MKRITGTVLIFLITIGVTYFCFYTELYINHFANIKEPEKQVFPKSEEVKDVSFYGIEFKNTNIGSNSLLTEYNIFLKENKQIKNSTFVYLDSSSISKPNMEELLNNNFKLITCFDRNYGSCLFYKQENGKTNVYDELGLYYVISKANRLPSTSTLKYNLKNNNYISIINDLGIDVQKEFVLGESSFYTENSIFKNEMNLKKEERFLMGIVLHFINFALILLLIFLFLETITCEEARRKDDGGIFFLIVLIVVLTAIFIGTSPFDFLISV